MGIEEKKLFDAWVQASKLSRGLDLLEWLKENDPEMYEDIDNYYSGLINNAASW